jgi:phosphoglycerol transferase MdoB-like AlkP superfamily enzyme
LLFTEFFANGQRSIEGLTALISALPSLPQRPNLAQGMAQSRLTYLGKMAQSMQYDTYFLQSSPGHSNRMDSIAALAGFDYYAGSGDIPLTGHTDHASDRWGWDYDMLFEANRLFARAKKPFLGFLFTSTTHLPYEFAGEKWRKYPDGSQFNDYLNALSYSDWSIGEFIKLAKESGYYDNTLFVFVGDHVSGQNKSSTVADQHRVGFFMLGKGINPGVNRTISSQVDLVPSLVDLLNWPVTYSGVGRSFFDEQTNASASTILIEGNVIAGNDKTSWMRHSLKSVLESSGDEGAANLEKIVLAKAGVIAHLLDDNKMSSE